MVDAGSRNNKVYIYSCLIYQLQHVQKPINDYLWQWIRKVSSGSFSKGSLLCLPKDRLVFMWFREK
jgi:hypothetical protein